MFYDFHYWFGILLIFVCGLHVAFLVLGCFYHVVTCSFCIVFILVMLLPLLSCCCHLFHIVVALHILYTLLPLALLFHMFFLHIFFSHVIIFEFCNLFFFGIVASVFFRTIMLGLFTLLPHSSCVVAFTFLALLLPLFYSR